jgi:guanylate kinase
MSSNVRGLLFIVSAPSGTGKTTLVERLVTTVPDLLMSRSFTSRPPRQGESDGVDYTFIDRPRFEEMMRAGEFLEWADVFGNYYGTARTETERILASGRDLVLVIDVQGARQVRRAGFDHVGIFVLPPSFAVLEARLRQRSKDSEGQIRRRLEVARGEVDAVADYDYVVVNDEIDVAVGRLEAIVTAERARRARMQTITERIVETFDRVESDRA